MRRCNSYWRPPWGMVLYQGNQWQLGTSCILTLWRRLFPYCWASKRPDVKNYKWRLNPIWHRMLYSCSRMETVGVKGLSGKQWLSSAQITLEPWHSDDILKLLSQWLGYHRTYHRVNGSSSLEPTATSFLWARVTFWLFRSRGRPPTDLHAKWLWHVFTQECVLQ